MTDELRRWAHDTWRSLDALTDPATGLPADHLAATLEPSSRSRYTSPTNIGGLLWSTVGARELGLIDAGECVTRCRAALSGLAACAGMRRPACSTTGTTRRPATGCAMPDGAVISQFLSSVDNGWLGAGLLVVRNGVPELRRQAQVLLGSMDFGFFHDPAADQLWAVSVNGRTGWSPRPGTTTAT